MDHLRHEDKPAWWRCFYLRTPSPGELTGEPGALGGLTGGEVVGQVGRSAVRRFGFPATGRTWRDKDGAERAMEPADILIVTPYNAQMVLANAMCRAWETGG